MRRRKAFLPLLVTAALVGVALFLRGVDVPQAPVVPDLPPRPTATTPAPVDPHADLYAATRSAVAAWQARDVRDIAVPDFPEPTGQPPQSPLAQMEVRVEADGMAAVDAALDDGTAITVVMVFDGRWLLADVYPLSGPGI